MKFVIKPQDSSRLEADILILYCYEGELKELNGFNKEVLNVIKEAASREEFEAKEKQTLIISSRGLLSSYKLLVVGLGKKEKFDLYRLLETVARSVKKAQEAKPARIVIVVPEFWTKQFTASKTIQSIVEGVTSSSYRFLRYKSDEEKKKERVIEEVFLSLKAAKISAGEEGIRLGLISSEAVLFARDLINEPAEITTPSYLSETALSLARVSDGRVKVKIFEKEDIAKLGMDSFLGVSSGSDKPPKFIHLSYRPASSWKKIVLVGKGVTFDTGGLSLKTPEFMETMKVDMAGAAAVLAVFKALPKLSPKVETVGLIAACENMPSGRALKPGDILKAMNGKTIEVLNTDAEGRLTLADAISYASLKEKPNEIIDIATLTGACMVALGQEVAGLWGNNEKFLQEIEKSALASGEKVWRMPLVDEYRELIKSQIADIKNIQTGKYGGAITAALFLQEFVDDISWAHLDIAGPAFSEKNTPLAPHGGVGFGVRLLLHYLSTR